MEYRDTKKRFNTVNYADALIAELKKGGERCQK